MNRVGKWLDRGRMHTSSSTHSLDSLAESQNMESALRAVELIMDDDMEGAERGLAQGNSAFHQLCKGVLGFMKATLGFEQDIMKEASEQLSAAETSAYNDHHRAQKDSRAFHSNIYEKGSEFALCQAEAQIMSAVVAVLNESLTESIKGFYKLRKAYVTLDGLTQMETTFMKARGVQSLASSRRQSSESLRSNHSTRSDVLNSTRLPSSPKRPPPAEARAIHPSTLRQAKNANDDSLDDSDDSDEFFDVEDIHDQNTGTGNDVGNPATSSELSPPVQKLSNLSVSQPSRSGSSSSVAEAAPKTASDLLTADQDDPMFSDPLDRFIHSGTNLCFGLLSLMISAIPPSFSKLLYIIGFRGDRERGMRMLWQASKFHNINGGMAGLVLFGWYNALAGFCDIITETDQSDPDDTEGYPAQRLHALLTDMRSRYPKSHLWLVEEARMAASHRDLDRGLEILDQPGKARLKQLEALHMFEKSISSMNAHRYQLCANSFIACVDLNSWSQALYYYIAGAAHLCMYRDLQGRSDMANGERELTKHKRLAEEYFKVAPTKSGKKKMMGRQLPFDTFVNRKILKWSARAEAWSCDFIDAIGVSPLEEMILLWNGFKKMDEKQLHVSLDNLAWSESAANIHWDQDEPDEKAILAVLRAVVYRNLRRHNEAKQILQDEILRHDYRIFKGLNKDDWTAPVAHYEMAVNLWMERSQYIQQYGRNIVTPNSAGEPQRQTDIGGDKKLVAECRAYLEKSKNWEKYELDARLGIKVTAGWDAVKKWEQKHGVTR